MRDLGHTAAAGTGVEFGLPWVEQQLARFKYKPNWTFKHLQQRIGAPLLDEMGDWVLIQAKVEDSRGAREPVYPYRVQAVPLPTRIAPDPYPFREPGVEIVTQPKIVTIGGRWLVDSTIVARRDEDAFARWLLDVVRQAEDHEMREWFRRDGELWDDPHKAEKWETGR